MTPAPARPAAPPPAERGRESREARNINEQCQRRARNRGRLIGGLVGGVAGGLAGRGRNPAAALATALPVSLLLGEAIARLLDCREQEQAAEATEQVVQQAAAAGGRARRAARRRHDRPLDQRDAARRDRLVDRHRA